MSFHGPMPSVKGHSSPDTCPYPYRNGSMITPANGKVLTRDFILCCLGQFAYGLVYYCLIPTLPIYLLRMGSIETQIGILIGALSFASMTFKPFAGKALLRTPEKSFLIAGSLFCMVTSLAYLMALPFWPFLIVRIIQGMGMGIYHTASFSYIARIGSDDCRVERLSYFLLSWNSAGALGPVIGMFLINQFGFPFLFLACTALSLCMLFTVGKLENIPIIHPSSSAESESIISVKALPPSIMNFLSFVIWGSIAAFFPIFAINKGVHNPGLFFTTVAVMLIFGRAMGGRVMGRWDTEKMIPPCIIAYVLSVGILAFSNTLPLFLLTAVIIGIGHAFLIPILMTYALERGGSSPGPVMGTFHSLVDLGLGLGPVVMGMVLHATSYRTMFLSLVIIGLANLGYFYFVVKKKG